MAKAATKRAPAKAAEPTTMTLAFAFERETKGAVRYQETKNGEPVEIGAGAVIGSVYVRKDALIGGAIPRRLLVTISFDTNDAVS